jgi:hypothetical protein
MQSVRLPLVLLAALAAGACGQRQITAPERAAPVQAAHSEGFLGSGNYAPPPPPPTS